jgi:predicted PurR-regulated permease PerM
MWSADNARRIRRLIVYGTLSVVGISLLVYLVWALRSLILPFVMAGFMAYLLRPFFNSVRGSKAGRFVRVIAFIGIITGVVLGGVRLVKSNLPTDKEKLEWLVRLDFKLNERFISLMGINAESGKGNFIYELGKNEIVPIVNSVNDTLELTDEQQKKFLNYYRKPYLDSPVREEYYQYFLANLQRRNSPKLTAITQDTVERDPSAEAAPTVVAVTSEEKPSQIASVISTMTTWLIMPLIFIFMLFDKGQIKKYMVAMVPNKYFELTLTVMNEVDRAIGRYIRGTLMECGLVGLTLFIGLFIIGINFKIALTIGVVAGLANAIPFLGPFIGLVVGLSYALIVEDISPFLPFITTENLMFGVLGAVIIAQVLDNAVFQPIILGNAVNLHPIVVILGVMGGSIIFGFAGMLLAIPTIVISKVILTTLMKELKAYRII